MAEYCGEADTAQAIRLTRHAEMLGVAAEASVAPYFFAYGAGPLFDPFRAIAEAAPAAGHYV